MYGNLQSTLYEFLFGNLFSSCHRCGIVIVQEPIEPVTEKRAVEMQIYRGSGTDIWWEKPQNVAYHSRCTDRLLALTLPIIAVLALHRPLFIVFEYPNELNMAIPGH